MKKNKFVLTQTDIIHLAICGLTPQVAKWDEMIKALANNPKEKKKMMEENEFFFKFKKLLELYELQTGVPYGLEFDFDFLKED